MAHGFSNIAGFLVVAAMSSFAAGDAVAADVQVGSIRIAGSAEPAGVKSTGASTIALRDLVSRTVAAQISDTPAGRFRIDVVVEPRTNHGRISYETRILIVDASTNALRHAVRATASAKMSRRAAKNARLSTRVAVAATKRAVADALSLVNG